MKFFEVQKCEKSQMCKITTIFKKQKNTNTITAKQNTTIPSPSQKKLWQNHNQRNNPKNHWCSAPENPVTTPHSTRKIKPPKSL